MFDSALELDTDDCAKLMVCHVFEKSEDNVSSPIVTCFCKVFNCKKNAFSLQLNSFEVKILKLFAHDLKKIDGKSSKAEYQLAAYVGSLKQGGLCQQKYPKCLANPSDLTKISL